MDYLNAVPPERVFQMHIAGHSDFGSYVLDTHDHPVRREVWRLFKKAHEIVGDVPLMLERDDKIPPFREVHAEVLKARKYMRSAGQTSKA